MKRSILLINASPRAEEQTASGAFLAELEKHFDPEKARTATIHVRESLLKHTARQDYEKISGADALVLAFPLYFFCIPGMLMRYLEDLKRYLDESGPEAHLNAKVYAIINCGFSESDINEEASRVVASFARQVSAEYRFSLLIGGGGMIVGAKKAPFMKKCEQLLEKGLSQIADDAQSEYNAPCESIRIVPNFPRRLYGFMVGRGFAHLGHKNGLSNKELRRMPYRASGK